MAAVPQPTSAINPTAPSHGLFAPMGVQDLGGLQCSITQAVHRLHGLEEGLSQRDEPVRTRCIDIRYKNG